MKTTRRVGLALLTLCVANTAMPAPVKPKLIVAIAVDQFSADLFAEYRQHFTGGLKRLSNGGVFPAGYQSHAATETCPGHATILTGARPARSGVIANNWFDLDLQRDNKIVYCAEDPTAPRDNFGKYVVSATLLKVPTLGDRLKMSDPQSRVVSVAGKDRSAVMMGGHRTDQMWFWAGKSFATFADRTAPAPAAVTTVNARTAAVLARPGRSRLPALCRSRSVAVSVAGNREVGAYLPRQANDVAGFLASDDFDTATADLAIGLLREMKLGQGAATDLLAIGLSATDYVGHTFGTAGAEMCAQIAALDTTIGRILSALDSSGVAYVVVLTADHGGHDVAERNRQRAFADASRVDPALMPARFGTSLAAEFGLNGRAVVGLLASGDWYLSQDIPPDLRPRVLAAAHAKLLAHPQIEAVFTAEELRDTPSPHPPVDNWSLRERARASFDPERSGDLILVLKPHITPFPVPIGVYIATHGSPWDYDRRVPILFWWPGMLGFEQPLSIETIDIMPTLAALIALPLLPDTIDGRCIDLDPGAATLCP